MGLGVQFPAQFVRHSLVAVHFVAHLGDLGGVPADHHCPQQLILHRQGDDVGKSCQGIPHKRVVLQPGALLLECVQNGKHIGLVVHIGQAVTGDVLHRNPGRPQCRGVGAYIAAVGVDDAGVFIYDQHRLLQRVQCPENQLAALLPGEVPQLVVLKPVDGLSFLNF